MKTSVTKDALVNHLRSMRQKLRSRWVHAMSDKGYIAGLTAQEAENESATIYDTCVQCLETGRYDSAQAYATLMAQRGVLQAMTAEQILGGMLTLRDIYGRSLFEKYQGDAASLSAALDIYEPVANRILSIVAMGFIEERERVVKMQEAIRELSTPVLELRKGLLLLPIIGVLDSVRARQLTEQLLKSIRLNRARVIVIDITGVPAVDSKVANHLLQTIEASRLMGAEVIITGISPEIAQTFVTIGVDLSKIKTMGELMNGIEEADRIVGYRVVASEAGASSRLSSGRT